MQAQIIELQSLKILFLRTKFLLTTEARSNRALSIDDFGDTFNINQELIRLRLLMFSRMESMDLDLIDISIM